MDYVGIAYFKESPWLLPTLALPFIIWVAILCLVAFIVPRSTFGLNYFK